MDHKWRRVSATPVPEKEQKRINRNRSIKKNEIFQEACKRAGVPATNRQASKWNNKRGAAFRGKK